MHLDTVNRRIQVKLAVAVAANQSSIVCSWVDMEPSGPVPGNTVTLTNSTTAVDVVGPPAANVQRIVKQITVHNLDSLNTTFIFSYKDGATVTEFQRAILVPNQTLTYDGRGRWEISPTQSGGLPLRTASITTDGTPTINTDNVDLFSITALASAITSMTTNLQGVKTPGQQLWVEIKDDGTPRDIVWGAAYEDAAEVLLPTRTVPNTVCRTLLSWNQAIAKFMPIWTYGGISSKRNFLIVFDGDSFTAGNFVTTPYPDLVVPADGITYDKVNVGVGSSTTPDSIARAYGAVDRLYRPDAGKNLVIFWSGQNDGFFGGTALQAFKDNAAYCRARQKAGWKVIVVTMPSRNGLDTFKNQLNTYLRANWPSFADFCADVAAVPVLGNDGAYANSTYFQTSGVGVGHFTDTGTALAAAVVNTAILQTWLNNGAVNRGRFKATKAGTDQTGIVPSTFTKVTFPTLTGDDVGKYYDATLSRWTPPYGPIAISARALVSAGVVDQSLGVLAIYKNGAVMDGGSGVFPANGTANWGLSTYVEDVANGVDNYEVHVFLAGAGNKTISGIAQYTCFSGFSK